MRKLSLIALAMLVGLGSSEAGTKPPALTAPRTYVSPSGVDSIYGNPACANIASPCQTLNYALSQTSPGGEVIVIASGNFGPVMIGPLGGSGVPSVTIEAAPGVYAGITPSGSSPAVAVNEQTGQTVVLRGLTINGGTGDGIDFNGGSSLSVENCVINGVGGTGIYDVSGGNLSVTNTVVRNGGGDGVKLNTSSQQVSLSHVWLDSNAGNGLNAPKGNDSISNSAISGNGEDGILVGGTADVKIESCLIANNHSNGVEVDLSTGLVSNSTVTDNGGIGLDQAGGTLYSRVNNTVAGNGTPTSGTITPLSPL